MAPNYYNTIGQWMSPNDSVTLTTSSGTTSGYLQSMSVDLGSAATATVSFKMLSHDYKITRDMLVDDGFCRIDGNVKIGAGKKTIELPDGAKLLVDDAGNYRIEDANAKVTYKANRQREFSPYLNASDMLARFVGYVGSLGLKRKEALELPIHLFISWLVIEACERDGDPLPPDLLPVAQDPVIATLRKPKCLTCGKFIRRLHQQHRFPFCAPEHATRYLARLPGPPAIAALPAPASVSA